MIKQLHFFWMIFISLSSLSQPTVHLLIQVVDESNNPIEGVKLYIQRPEWSRSEWIPDRGRNQDPETSIGDFYYGYTINSERLNIKANLISRLNGLHDLYPGCHITVQSAFKIKLTREGYRDVTDKIQLQNTNPDHDVMIEKSYYMERSYDGDTRQHDQGAVRDYSPNPESMEKLTLINHFGSTPLYIYIDGRPMRRWPTKPVVYEFDKNHESFTGGAKFYIDPGEHQVMARTRDGSIKRSTTIYIGKQTYDNVWHVE